MLDELSKIRYTRFPLGTVAADSERAHVAVGSVGLPFLTPE